MDGSPTPNLRSGRLTSCVRRRTRTAVSNGYGARRSCRSWRSTTTGTAWTSIVGTACPASAPPWLARAPTRTAKAARQRTQETPLAPERLDLVELGDAQEVRLPSPVAETLSASGV